MKILALETATEACSAALLVEGGVIERFEVAPRRHTELILPMVGELLAESGLQIRQLDALAFGRGPGAFTGVRIAAGVAQGLALGAGLPLIPVSTLAALALEVLEEPGATHALVALDARMGEVYWGVYQRFSAGTGTAGSGRVRLLGAEQVAAPDKVRLCADLGDGGVGVGAGWKAHEEVLGRRFGKGVRAIFPDRLPRAAQIARLAAHDARTVAPEEAVPVYLRDRVASVRADS